MYRFFKLGGNRHDIINFGVFYLIEAMEFITSFFGNLNYEAIVQLTFVALIMLAGPIVIFVLAFRGGDL